MGEMLLYLGIIAVATVVVWKGSDLLEDAAEKLSAYYGLPSVVHGTIVVAVGSSFPELSSTVLATLLHGEFELGLSTVVGSAIFNILVIPGLSGLAAKKTLKTDRDLVYKDAQFYITSVAMLIITFCFAVIYNPKEGGTNLEGYISPLLALAPLALYGLYIFIQAQDVKDAKQPRDKTVNVKRAWFILFISLILIVAGVEGLVNAAIFMGDYFGTPSFLWGILVIATATSIPDAIISVRLAKRGDSVSSLGNVIGSNIFDLLVAIPAGVIIAGPTLISLGVAVPLLAVLTLATLQLFISMRLRLGLSIRESWLLLFSYSIFIVWMIFETFGITTWIPGAQMQ
ncbi:MAG TPA: sodium:calcium antiporter [Cytophagales bacterium]|nr:sodium:calcium antiporter [Cytophagales bacterium]HAA22327.1 sodium:calcium antiporter [Cytophagales bacterium]